MKKEVWLKYDRLGRRIRPPPRIKWHLVWDWLGILSLAVVLATIAVWFVWEIWYTRW